MNKKVGMSQNWAEIGPKFVKLAKYWYYVHYETKKYIIKYKMRVI